MALVIKKPVDLSSLGDEYKGIEFVFKSLPAQELPELDKKREAFEKDEDGNPKLKDTIPFFTEVLKSKFLSGTQDGKELTKEDLDSLDENSMIYCFQIITGQITDPKVLSESKTTSSTEAEEAQK